MMRAGAAMARIQAQLRLGLQATCDARIRQDATAALADAKTIATYAFDLALAWLSAPDSGTTTVSIAAVSPDEGGAPIVRIAIPSELAAELHAPSADALVVDQATLERWIGRAAMEMPADAAWMEAAPACAAPEE